MLSPEGWHVMYPRQHRRTETTQDRTRRTYSPPFVKVDTPAVKPWTVEPTRHSPLHHAASRQASPTALTAASPGLQLPYTNHEKPRQVSPSPTNRPWTPLQQNVHSFSPYSCPLVPPAIVGANKDYCKNSTALRSEVVQASTISSNSSALPDRGRLTRADALGISAFRRNSRPRRPVSERARLRGQETQTDYNHHQGVLPSSLSMDICNGNNATRTYCESQNLPNTRISQLSEITSCPGTTYSTQNSNQVKPTTAMQWTESQKTYMRAESRDDEDGKQSTSSSIQTSTTVGCSRMNRRTTDEDSTHMKAERPTIPPLALNKILRTNDTVCAQYQIDFGCHYAPSSPRPPAKSLPTFSDCIRACAQPIHHKFKISSALKPVYAEWIKVALKADWIERCAKSDCHILLKPKLSKRPDGTWKISHDCSVVNAMATANCGTASCQDSTNVIHSWALTQRYTARIDLHSAFYSVPLDPSQCPYYGLSTDNEFFRYKVMPKEALGASRHLQRAIKWALDDLSPQNRALVKSRREEIYVGGNTRHARQSAISETIAVLENFGFRPSVPSTRALESSLVPIAGLVHDRNQRCLVVSSARVSTITDLVAGLHTTQWVDCAEQILSILHQVQILIPIRWKRESNNLRRLLQTASTSALLPPSVYLLWDNLPREIASWTRPFDPVPNECSISIPNESFQKTPS